MADPIAQYSFVPWLRQGIAAEIAEADHLAEQPDAGPLGRAGIDAALIVGFVPKGGGAEVALPAVPKRVEILSPRDIATIKAQAILRTEPYGNAVNATPGELAYVEFYEEDFPWRYTPARPAAANEDPARRHKLRPWIALFVLRDSEFTFVERPGAVPVLTLAAGVDLPPVTEAWAWAHAQISRAVAAPGDAPQAIADSPDHALSRLLSPRRLVADTAYHGFVVPAFETGRLAGLGLDSTNVPAQKPSWQTAEAQADPRYPVYFHWNFKTGTAGDFETLVRKLTAGPVGERFGKRAMDISDPGYGVTAAAGDTVDLEGALQPPDFTRQNFPAVPGAALASQIQSVIDLSQNLQEPGVADLPNPLAPAPGRPSGYTAMLRPSGVADDVPDDPIVTPPAYGRWHADVARVADAAGDATLAWLPELNLDPRSRAAAGLGSEVVKERQDEFMERAWKQVGRLEDANQRLREAELAIAAGEALFTKHVAQAGTERVLTLTAAAQRGLSGPAPGQSIRGLVAQSRVPVAAQAAAFKRVTRPQRKLMRRLTGASQVEGFQKDLLVNMNREPEQATSAARPKPEPGAAVGLNVVADAVAASLVEFVAQGTTPRQLFLELLHDDLRGRRRARPPQDFALLAVATLKAALAAALAARIPPAAPPEQAAVAQHVRDLIDAIVALAPNGRDAATVTVRAAVFNVEFGDAIAGKAYRGVTVVSDAPPADGEIARATTLSDIQQYQLDLQRFDTELVSARPLPSPPPALPPLADIAATVLDRMRPGRAGFDRVASALPGVDGIIRGRQADAPRRTRPVMAYPVLPDPMFEPLRKLSQDYILPNISDLARDTITLMEPNQRFVEAFLAGINHEMASELLWREYPTDLRGTYFRVFWDTRDALDQPGRADIKPMHEWRDALGAQFETAPATLVLVIRGELLLKYPNTVVYAQEADWTDGDPLKPRRFKPDGVVKFPSFHATLEPDVAIIGFDLSKEAARGHRRTDPADLAAIAPGWFFVLKERPGQVRFGLDEHAPARGLAGWEDLSWDAIQFPGGTSYLRIGDNAALAPQNPGAAAWGRTSADMAYILFQTPILYARHAEEMLAP